MRIFIFYTVCGFIAIDKIDIIKKFIHSISKIYFKF